MDPHLPEIDERHRPARAAEQETPGKRARADEAEEVPQDSWTAAVAKRRSVDEAALAKRPKDDEKQVRKRALSRPPPGPHKPHETERLATAKLDPDARRAGPRTPALREGRSAPLPREGGG